MPQLHAANSDLAEVEDQNPPADSTAGGEFTLRRKDGETTQNYSEAAEQIRDEGLSSSQQAGPGVSANLSVSGDLNAEGSNTRNTLQELLSPPSLTREFVVAQPDSLAVTVEKTNCRKAAEYCKTESSGAVIQPVSHYDPENETLKFPTSTSHKDPMSSDIKPLLDPSEGDFSESVDKVLIPEMQKGSLDYRKNTKGVNIIKAVSQQQNEQRASEFDIILKDIPSKILRAKEKNLLVPVPEGAGSEMKPSVSEVGDLPLRNVFPEEATEAKFRETNQVGCSDGQTVKSDETPQKKRKHNGVPFQQELVEFGTVAATSSRTVAVKETHTSREQIRRDVSVAPSAQERAADLEVTPGKYGDKVGHDSHGEDPRSPHENQLYAGKPGKAAEKHCMTHRVKVETRKFIEEGEDSAEYQDLIAQVDAPGDELMHPQKLTNRSTRSHEAIAEKEQLWSSKVRDKTSKVSQIKDRFQGLEPKLCNAGVEVNHSLEESSVEKHLQSARPDAGTQQLVTVGSPAEEVSKRQSFPTEVPSSEKADPVGMLRTTRPKGGEGQQAVGGLKDEPPAAAEDAKASDTSESPDSDQESYPTTGQSEYPQEPQQKPAGAPTEQQQLRFSTGKVVLMRNTETGEVDDRDVPGDTITVKIEPPSVFPLETEPPSVTPLEPNSVSSFAPDSDTPLEPEPHIVAPLELNSVPLLEPEIDTVTLLDPDSDVPVEPDNVAPLEPGRVALLDPDIITPVEPDSVALLEPETDSAYPLETEPDNVSSLEPESVNSMEPDSVTPLEPETDSVALIQPDCGAPVKPDSVVQKEPDSADRLKPDSVSPVEPDSVPPLETEPDSVSVLEPEGGIPVKPNSAIQIEPNSFAPVEHECVPLIKLGSVDPQELDSIAPLEPDTDKVLKSPAAALKQVTSKRSPEAREAKTFTSPSVVGETKETLSRAGRGETFPAWSSGTKKHVEGKASKASHKSVMERAEQLTAVDQTSAGSAGTGGSDTHTKEFQLKKQQNLDLHSETAPVKGQSSHLGVCDTTNQEYAEQRLSSAASDQSVLHRYLTPEDPSQDPPSGLEPLQESGKVSLRQDLEGAETARAGEEKEVMSAREGPGKEIKDRLTPQVKQSQKSEHVLRKVLETSSSVQPDRESPQQSEREELEGPAAGPGGQKPSGTETPPTDQIQPQENKSQIKAPENLCSATRTVKSAVLLPPPSRGAAVLETRPSNLEPPTKQEVLSGEISQGREGPLLHVCFCFFALSTKPPRSEEDRHPHHSTHLSEHLFVC